MLQQSLGLYQLRSSKGYACILVQHSGQRVHKHRITQVELTGRVNIFGFNRTSDTQYLMHSSLIKTFDRFTFRQFHEEQIWYPEVGTHQVSITL